MMTLMMNNMCETFIGFLVDTWSKTIITMLKDIKQNVMTRVVVKREFASKWQAICGTNIIAKLESRETKFKMTSWVEWRLNPWVILG